MKEKFNEVIRKSFLQQLIEGGFNEFIYSNGKFYVGRQHEFINLAEIQPSKNTLMQLIGAFADVVNTKFNELNPYIEITDEYVQMYASLLNNKLQTTIVAKEMS